MSHFATPSPSPIRLEYVLGDGAAAVRAAGKLALKHIRIPKDESFGWGMGTASPFFRNYSLLLDIASPLPNLQRGGLFVSIDPFLPLVLFASMLADADSIGQQYARAVAKRPPPSLQPQARGLLNTTSCLAFYRFGVACVSGPAALESLSGDVFWQTMQDLGIDGCG